MKIKIIESDPANGQGGINHLIGEEFNVIYFDKEELEYSVIEEGNGEIVINQSECIVIE